MNQRIIQEAGYGGNDVLQFKETKTQAYSIHRIYEFDKRVDRFALIDDPTSAHRRFVSDGCINIKKSVYDKLFDCCRRFRLVIRE